MNNIELYVKLETMIEIMRNIGISFGVTKRLHFHILGYIEFLIELRMKPGKESADKYLNFKRITFYEDENSYYCAQLRRSLRQYVYFYENNELCPPKLSVSAFKPGLPFGSLIGEFLDYRRNSCISEVTVKNEKHQLNIFNQYCADNQFSSITAETLSSFIQWYSTSESCTPNRFYDMVAVLKFFIRFCYNNAYIQESLESTLPKPKYPRTQRLPSVYSDEEILKILSCVDRSSAAGKRDYAILLLDTCYGIRAGDIAALKFENFDWDNSLIRLIMGKTGKEISLPLFSDVGNAIIDWLRYGRRESSLPYIFITIKGPISPIKSSCINRAVNKHISLCGLDKRYRKHGSHALRHSLATRLLNQGEKLTTISEVLGHGDTQVTTVYLGLDIENLRKCSLEVPPIHSRTYGEN